MSTRTYRLVRTLLTLPLLALSGCATLAPERQLWLPGDDQPSATLVEAISLLNVSGACRAGGTACAEAIAAARGPLRESTRVYALAEAWHTVAAAGGTDADVASARCAAAAHHYLFAPVLDGRARALEAPAQQAVRLYNDCAARWLARRVSEPGFVASAAPRWHVRQPAFPVHSVERLALAATIDTRGFRTRQQQDGLGVPLVAVPLPDPESSRPLEPRVLPLAALLRFDDAADDSPTLELHDGFDAPTVITALGEVSLAVDFTAAYAQWAASLPGPVDSFLSLADDASALVAPRVDLLQPYDPARKPIILIHGLASGPRTWLDLANELLGDPRLAPEYQIWICRYATALPLLANRQAIESALDGVVAALDPEGDDAALGDAVLVGHSMGGVLSRLLVSSSGDLLWDAAFATQPDALVGTAEDRAAAQSLFFFEPWSPATRAVFIAAPHRGAPAAVSWVGRLARGLVRIPPQTFGFLARLAQADPAQVRELVRDSYLSGGPKSIDALSPSQPVTQASLRLQTSPRVSTHVISGITNPNAADPGDGVVPLSSTEWPGAASRVVVESSHDVHKHPDAILEIKRVLLEHADRP